MRTPVLGRIELPIQEDKQTPFITESKPPPREKINFRIFLTLVDEESGGALGERRIITFCFSIIMCLKLNSE